MDLPFKLLAPSVLPSKVKNVKLLLQVLLVRDQVVLSHDFEAIVGLVDLNCPNGGGLREEESSEEEEWKE